MTIRLTFFIMAVLVAFLGAWMSLHGLGSAYDDIRLRFKGKTGSVVKIVYRSDVGDNKVYFRADDGKEDLVYMFVSDAVRAKVDHDGSVPVRYLPYEPSVNRVDGERSGGVPITLFGLFMIAAGVYMMRVFSRGRR